MKDKYGNELNEGDEVAFAFYDYFNCECFIQKAPIKSIDEENHSVTLDVRGTGILDSSEYEDGNPIYLDFKDEVILVKRKKGKENEACANQQPISEQEGWIDFNSQHPTEDGYYLVETPDFYKNCEFIVAEWSNHAERFYEEAFDNPIEVKKYKLIYTT